MESFEHQRRDFLFALGALGLAPLVRRMPILLRSPTHPGYVLAPMEGEHLIHFRDGGDIFIKVGGETGSTNLAVGTQQVKVGTGIPVHRHPATDEAFHVLEGSGTVILDDVRHSFDQGSTIFIPRDTWHGFENPNHQLQLQWIVAPAGLDAFFRETCSPPGLPPKALTRAQIREIALKHDTEFR